MYCLCTKTSGKRQMPSDQSLAWCDQMPSGLWFEGIGACCAEASHAIQSIHPVFWRRHLNSCWLKLLVRPLHTHDLSAHKAKFDFVERQQAATCLVPRSSKVAGPLPLRKPYVTCFWIACRSAWLAKPTMTCRNQIFRHEIWIKVFESKGSHS